MCAKYTQRAKIACERECKFTRTESNTKPQQHSQHQTSQQHYLQKRQSAGGNWWCGAKKKGAHHTRRESSSSRPLNSRAPLGIPKGLERAVSIYDAGGLALLVFGLGMSSSTINRTHAHTIPQGVFRYTHQPPSLCDQRGSWIFFYPFLSGQILQIRIKVAAINWA